MNNINKLNKSNKKKIKKFPLKQKWSRFKNRHPKFVFHTGLIISGVVLTLFLLHFLFFYKN
jgi:hypothetical protein